METPMAMKFLTVPAVVLSHHSVMKSPPLKESKNA
jgi:hypothetical protein